MDLDSLLTHEAGHLLGLGHTQDRAATMFPGYTRGSTGLRSLGYDDVSGLCAIYPDSRKVTSTSCLPRHGFSELCGADQPAVAASNSTNEQDSSSTGGCSLSPRAGGSASAFFAALSACDRRIPWASAPTRLILSQAFQLFQQRGRRDAQRGRGLLVVPAMRRQRLADGDAFQTR